MPRHAPDYHDELTTFTDTGERIETYLDPMEALLQQQKVSVVYDGYLEKGLAPL